LILLKNFYFPQGLSRGVVDSIIGVTPNKNRWDKYVYYIKQHFVEQDYGK